MSNWWRKNVDLFFKVWWRNLPIILIANLTGYTTLIVTYFLLKNSLEQNGFWVILSYYLAAMTVAILSSCRRRNDPRYYSYYLVHLSKISTLVILSSLSLFALLFLYAQCKEYGVTISLDCINLILNPPHL